jgi:hypothetical protein
MKHFESQEEYYNAKKELMDIFYDDKFVTEYLYRDATFRKIFELLLRDESPFEMIKWLIKDRQMIIDKLHELITLMPPTKI